MNSIKYKELIEAYQNIYEQQIGIPLKKSTDVEAAKQLQKMIPAGEKVIVPKTKLQNAHLDLFDLVKGYLIDEGFAETEESAIAIMANMSEEWKLEIIDEAVKGESSDRRKALAAERRKGIKPLSAKEGEKYASHKISQMAYTKRAKMGDDD